MANIWPPIISVGIVFDIYPPNILPDPANMQIVIAPPGAVIIRGEINSEHGAEMAVIVFDTQTDFITTIHGKTAFSIDATAAISPFVACYQPPGRKFKQNTVLKVGDIVRPSLFDGWVYQVVESGQSGGVEPLWWLPFNRSDKGKIGTATAKVMPYSMPRAHGPIDLER